MLLFIIHSVLKQTTTKAHVNQICTFFLLAPQSIRNFQARQTVLSPFRRVQFVIQFSSKFHQASMTSEEKNFCGRRYRIPYSIVMLPKATDIIPQIVRKCQRCWFLRFQSGDFLSSIFKRFQPPSPSICETNWQVLIEFSSRQTVRCSLNRFEVSWSTKKERRKSVWIPRESHEKHEECCIVQCQ